MAAFSEEYSSASLKGKNAFVRESKAVASSTIWGLSMKYHPSIQAQKNNTTCYIRECLTATQKTLSELKKERKGTTKRSRVIAKLAFGATIYPCVHNGLLELSPKKGEIMVL